MNICGTNDGRFYPSSDRPCLVPLVTVSPPNVAYMEKLEWSEEERILAVAGRSTGRGLGIPIQAPATKTTRSPNTTRFKLGAKPHDKYLLNFAWQGLSADHEELQSSSTPISVPVGVKSLRSNLHHWIITEFDGNHAGTV